MRRGRNIIPFLIIVAIFIAPCAICQTKEEWRKTENGSGDEIKKDLPYNGVIPGTGNTLPKVASLLTKPGTWVTWPGFTVHPDGGTRLFLQTTGKIQYKQKKKSATLITIDLGKARVYLGNNRNPLVTDHFNTPLRKAYLKWSKKRLELFLELKVETVPQISQIQDDDGYNYVFIDFPPGDYPIPAVH